MTLEANWLPVPSDWEADLRSLQAVNPSEALSAAASLATHRLDFLQTGQLDRALQRMAKKRVIIPKDNATIRLALLGSSTLRHLIPGIRIAALRRGLWVEIFEGDYGQYLQELLDNSSGLHAFAPQFVCFAFDSVHIEEIAQGNPENALQRLTTCWKLAADAFSCTVIQQTPLPVFPDLLGNNEHRMLDSAQWQLEVLTRMMEPVADEMGVNLLSLHKYAARCGVASWYDPALWLRTQQEVHPKAGPMYGELLMRLIGAQRGLSSKCLVLDLDNTLWGGVIGDDGMNGIALGPGNPIGEAFMNFQRYALTLKARGIVLAICSKNEEIHALQPFEEHPSMVLKRRDISCFVANWNDKVSNLRSIAKTLNIGLDSLVFVDDNPFERNLIRQELPQVRVPEMPEDPALYIETVSSAGYFEGLNLTEEDRVRAEQYRANAERDSLRETTDLAGYLASLQMELLWSPFDEKGLQRIVQLNNKTNQFNVTTRRYTEPEIRSLMSDPKVLTWQVRLKDRFGDNGVIALLIGRLDNAGDFTLETFLMSCRVLGRQVEEACLSLVVEGAKKFGALRILGLYLPTVKNGMVKDLYRRLGFELLHADEQGSSEWALGVNSFAPQTTHMVVREGVHAGI